MTSPAGFVTMTNSVNASTRARYRASLAVNAARVAACSEQSNPICDAPINEPDESSTGESCTQTQRSLPSFARRTVSNGPPCSPRARVAIAARNSSRRSSGMIKATERPTTSSACQPNNRSDARFHRKIVPSRSSRMNEKAAASTLDAVEASSDSAVSMRVERSAALGSGVNIEGSSSAAARLMRSVYCRQIGRPCSRLRQT